MNLLAIDPGTTASAWVLFDGARVADFAKQSNNDALRVVQTCSASRCVIEQVASYGMPVGAEVFETVHWAGRFHEAAAARGIPVDRITRNTVKTTLCRSAKANDAAIRQRLIDLYGGKASAVGTKKAPGPLYGVHGDVWAALALAVTWFELEKEKAIA